MYILLAVGWFACGFIGYGLCIGHCEHRWPTLDRKTDRIFGALCALSGPADLLAALIMCSRPYRWKL